MPGFCVLLGRNPNPLRLARDDEQLARDAFPGSRRRELLHAAHDEAGAASAVTTCPRSGRPRSAPPVPQRVDDAEQRVLVVQEQVAARPQRRLEPVRPAVEVADPRERVVGEHEVETAAPELERERVERRLEPRRGRLAFPRRGDELRVRLDRGDECAPAASSAVPSPVPAPTWRTCRPSRFGSRSRTTRARPWAAPAAHAAVERLDVFLGRLHHATGRVRLSRGGAALRQALTALPPGCSPDRCASALWPPASRRQRRPGDVMETITPGGEPPSTMSVWPQTIAASAEQRKATAPAMSSGSTIRPAGVRSRPARSISSRFGKWSSAPVSTTPPETALTRIPRGASSTPR